MSLAFQAQLSSSCSCPAAAGSIACSTLRHSRLKQASTASWQRNAPAVTQPLNGWLQRRPTRPFASHGTLAAQFSAPASPSVPAQEVQAPCCPSPQGSSLATSAAAAAPAHTHRWGRARARSPCRAVDSAATGMGLSGAGPPSHGRPDAAATSAPQPSSQSQQNDAQRQPAPLATSNGHPAATASSAAASAAAAPGSTPTTGSGNTDPAAATATSGSSAESTTAAATPSDDPSDHGATSVDGMDDTRKFVFADEWGFSRVGGDLPSGTTPATFADMFPERFFDFDMLRASLAIAVPLAAMAAGYGWLWYMHSICPFWQQLLCAALIGTAYTGLFKVAHECARFAFLPQSPRLQDAVGLVLMLPSLYPFTSWRIHYMNHLAHLNMLWEDTFGWHPYTKVQLATEVLCEDRLALALRRLVLTTPLKLFASVGHWLRSFDGLDLRHFDPETYGAVLAGWAVPILFLGFGVPAIIGTWGVSGFVTGYVLPWLVFHFWLSTLSLLQHTAPHIPFRAEGEGYDFGRAAVCGTVTVRLPRPLEVLLNDANYSLPQLLAPGLPVFRVREAYEYMRERLLPYLTEATLSVRLLTNHVTCWQVYDEEQQTYLPMEEVLHSVESDIETIMEEAAKAEAAEVEAAAAAMEAPGNVVRGGEEGGALGQGTPVGRGPAFA